MRKLETVSKGDSAMLVFAQEAAAQALWAGSVVEGSDYVVVVSEGHGTVSNWPYDIHELYYKTRSDTHDGEVPKRLCSIKVRPGPRVALGTLNAAQRE